MITSMDGKMAVHDQKLDGVPQFVSYFVPMTEIMRDLGGQARSKPSRGVLGLLKQRWKADLCPEWSVEIFRKASVNFSPD
jgi:hypothetical protein